jgi:hypothetical protein
MKRTYLLTVLVLFLSNVLPVFKALGQTIIKTKKIHFYNKDYKSCAIAAWDLSIPSLSASSAKDVRHTINRCISKLVSSVLKDTLSFPNTNPKEVNPDCDTTGSLFTLEYQYNIRYDVARNTKTLLSFQIFSESVSGGGGNGFGTDYYCFNVDLRNNKLLTIHNLFNKENTKKLRNYIIKHAKGYRELFLFDEEFNIFGKSADHPATGSYEFVGFIIDKKDLVLQYSFDHSGRGNGINELRVSLKNIKSLISKKYLWLFEN